MVRRVIDHLKAHRKKRTALRLWIQQQKEVHAVRCGPMEQIESQRGLLCLGCNTIIVPREELDLA
jgi:hypothetical protein